MSQRWQLTSNHSFIVYIQDHLNQRELTFQPSFDVLFRCVRVYFNDDYLVEADKTFMVIFEPVNMLDVFVDGNNVVNVTILDDDGKLNINY